MGIARVWHAAPCEHAMHAKVNPANQCEVGVVRKASLDFCVETHTAAKAARTWVPKQGLFAVCLLDDVVIRIFLHV